jgi:hypothetical protein
VAVIFDLEDIYAMGTAVMVLSELPEPSVSPQYPTADEQWEEFPND